MIATDNPTLLDTWTVDRLAEELALEADLASVRNALYFWANQGLLKEVEVGTWRALERQEAGSAAARHGETSIPPLMVLAGSSSKTPTLSHRRVADAFRQCADRADTEGE